jgi:hypothetical protein
VALAATALPLRLFTQPPSDERSYNAPKVRFSATLGQEPEVEVELGTGKALMPESQTGRLSPIQDCE